MLKYNQYVYVKQKSRSQDNEINLKSSSVVSNFDELFFGYSKQK